MYVCVYVYGVLVRDNVHEYKSPYAMLNSDPLSMVHIGNRAVGKVADTRLLLESNFDRIR